MGSAAVSQDTPCSWANCPLGGVIKANDIKVWGQRGPTAGLPYHPACIHPAREEREREEARRERETTPAPVPPPVVPAPVVPTPANLGDAAGKIAEAMAIIQGAARPALDRESVEAIVRETLESAKDSFGVRRIEVTHRDRPAVDCGIQHKSFPVLLDLVASGESVYLYGPAGTGKTQACIEAAKALSLDYAVISMSPQSPASKLEGFVDAQGRFTNPDFYRLYTGGGVFIIDEFDNMSASAATVINSALSNGIASFPNGQAERHPDFIFLATGNTAGRGPTAQYPERRKLDTASLDRVWFEAWNPDEALELSLSIAHAGGKDEQAKRWVRWVQAVREYIQRPDCGIGDPVYCGMRPMIVGAKQIAHPPAWLTIDRLAASTVFKGLAADKVSRIIAAVPLPQGVL